MLKKYLLYGIFGCLLVLVGCNKDEEEITSPSYADRNWFVIPDKPGEFNQLVYKIYAETGVPIFVSDTLGEEYYAKDAEGNPILRTEKFNLSYVMFGSTEDDRQGSTHYIVQSSDTPAMLKAAELIRNRVLPHVPKVGEALPKCYFLVDSLNENANLILPWSQLPCRIENKPLYVAMKGVVVGQLCDILQMTDEEIDLWCGRVIASKLVSWMLNGNMNMDLVKWYAITNEGTRDAYYNKAYASTASEYNFDVYKDMGMLGWYVDIPDVRATYTQEDDLIEYVARVYAYRGCEQEFLDRYADYDKVLRKFQMMQGFVNTFEEWWDLK
ncbi:hypothetical protein [Butyricimonas faecihominis]|uniref:hypothetical protein n=1 Tax=Butyricimonas faecihominis TaxID=1472416 RepID=UPI0034A4FDFF